MCAHHCCRLGQLGTAADSQCKPPVKTRALTAHPARPPHLSPSSSLGCCSSPLHPRSMDTIDHRSLHSFLPSVVVKPGQSSSPLSRWQASCQLTPWASLPSKESPTWDSTQFSQLSLVRRLGPPRCLGQLTRPMSSCCAQLGWATSRSSIVPYPMAM
ncbi:hypothetical protein C8F01DRAFT_1105393 [Mycena amicta]|nr:hypothetical protein C8F01DRAFT_1105393 [Mycena amicta]